MQHEWEPRPDWDWKLCWQQLREFLWQYWPVIAASVVFAVAVAATAGSAALPAAPTVSAATAPSVAAVSGIGGTVAAVVQLAGPLVGMAATGLAANYAWQNRWEFSAIVAGTMTLSWLPAVVRCVLCRRRYQDRKLQPQHVDRGAFFGDSGCADRDANIADSGSPMGSSPMKRKRQPRVDAALPHDAQFVATPPRCRSQQPQSPHSAPPRTGAGDASHFTQFSRRLLAGQEPVCRPLVFNHQQE